MEFVHSSILLYVDDNWKSFSHSVVYFFQLLFCYVFHVPFCFHLLYSPSMLCEGNGSAVEKVGSPLRRYKNCAIACSNLSSYVWNSWRNVEMKSVNQSSNLFCTICIMWMFSACSTSGWTIYCSFNFFSTFMDMYFKNSPAFLSEINTWSYLLCLYWTLLLGSSTYVIPPLCTFMFLTETPICVPSHASIFSVPTPGVHFFQEINLEKHSATQRATW